MRIGNIYFEDIIGTNLFSENPNTCFVSPIYTKDINVIKNGTKLTLDDSADYRFLLERQNIDNNKIVILIKSTLFIVVFSFIMSFFGTLIKIGPGLLFKEPGYWKYMALQLSILSAFLFGFANIFESIYFKKAWTQRCISNANVINPNKEEKCSIDTAKSDLNEMFSHCSVSLNNKRVIPYGDNYFAKISKKIKHYSYNVNFLSEYNKELSLINNRSSLLKSISSLIVGAGIETFTFIDLYSELVPFRTNLIISALLIASLSIFLGYFLVDSKFNRTYIKLDSLLYLYSYMYLDMPFNPKTEEYVTIEIKDANPNNKDAMIEYEISQLEKTYNEYVFFRLVILDSNCLKVYGLNNRPLTKY